MMVLLDGLLNGFLITSFVLFYVSSKILSEKINYKSLKFWLIILGYFGIITIINEYATDLIRIMTGYLLLTVLNKYLFKTNFVTIFFASFITLLLFLISEIIYVIGITIIFNIELGEYYSINVFYSNMVISLIVLLLINIKKLIAFFNKTILSLEYIIKKTVVMVSLVSIFTFAILLYYTYFEVSLVVGLVISFILVITYIFLIFKLFKELINNVKLQNKYNDATNYLKDYENLLEIQRMENHENKNHLIVIRDMVGNSSKKTVEYINTILNEKINEDQEIMIKMRKLPSGGLRGLLYQKAIIMKEKKINLNLEISKKLNKTIFENICVETYNHLCAIIGVQIDNAIEASEKLDDGNVSINIYEETNFIIITIANKYEGIIDLEKIDNMGYSTKGKGRGYGLSLVKQILEKNNKIKVNREIIGNIFKISIKLKI